MNNKEDLLAGAGESPRANARLNNHFSERQGVVQLQGFQSLGPKVGTPSARPLCFLFFLLLTVTDGFLHIVEWWGHGSGFIYVLLTAPVLTIPGKVSDWPF